MDNKFETLKNEQFGKSCFLHSPFCHNLWRDKKRILTLAQRGDGHKSGDKPSPESACTPEAAAPHLRCAGHSFTSGRCVCRPKTFWVEKALKDHGLDTLSSNNNNNHNHIESCIYCFIREELWGAESVYRKQAANSNRLWKGAGVASFRGTLSKCLW